MASVQTLRAPIHVAADLDMHLELTGIPVMVSWDQTD